MGKKKKQSPLIIQVKSIFLQNSTKTFNHKQLGAQLGIYDPSGRNQLIKVLNKLTLKGELTEVSKGKYKIKQSIQRYTGTIQITRQGKMFIISESFDQDLLVDNKNHNHAFDKDTVHFLVKPRRGTRRNYAEIINIIKRFKTDFVGEYELRGNIPFVRPQQHSCPTDFLIIHSYVKDLRNGDRVLIEMNDWPIDAKYPNATLKKVFGKPGETETEIHSILAEHGLSIEFSPELLEAANKIDTTIKESETQQRKDYRSKLTFTIDPKDAKDFDDALSFFQLDQDHYEIGIHIADVSHYVKEGSLLDQEAYDRGTSVYLVDRVVPMLPEVLSNSVCSLRPNEDKYTFSAVFTMNSSGVIQDTWFGKTIITSDYRFSYEEAQYILDTESTIIPSTVSLTNKDYKVTNSLKNALLYLNSVAKLYRQKRMNNGAISFDKKEVKFTLNANNLPDTISFKTTQDANKLIEEFMLLANKSVASFIAEQSPSKTFVYRVHDEPDDQKLMNLVRVIGTFGYQLNLTTPLTTAKSINTLLKKVKGKKEQNLIDVLTIRSMSKAVYTTDNIGHYGLAFEHYTHFTSPIRRYPDVVVHRLLQHYLDCQAPPKETIYKTMMLHCSNREQLATKAERDSIKFMQVVFMSNHIGKQYKGVISGVTERGIYVEINENKCEGMVRLSDIRGDYYVYDEKNYAMIGQQTKQIFQLGDQVVVEVKYADAIKRHLDFFMVGHA